MVLSEMKNGMTIYKYDGNTLNSYYVISLGVSPTKYGYLVNDSVVPILIKDLKNLYLSIEDANQGTLFEDYSY
jgi:hypothetical protein